MKLLHVALALLLLCAPAWAQDDAIKPVIIEGKDSTPPEAVLIPSPINTPAKEEQPAVEVTPLPPRTLWEDTAYSVATPLVQQTAVALLEGSMNEAILKNIALHMARDDGPAPLGTAQEGGVFYESRALLMGAAGDTQSATALVKNNSGFISEKGAQRLSAVLLMQGDLDSACADQHVTQSPEAFWQKLAVICTLRSGKEAAKVQLSLDTMREAGEKDTLFLDLAEAAVGNKKLPTTKPASVPALHAALLAASGMAPSAAMLDVLAQNPYPLLLQIAAPDEWRLRIAQMLAVRNAMSQDALSELMMHVALKTDAMRRIRQDPGTMTNEKFIPNSLRVPYALQVVHSTSGGSAKAKIIATLIEGLPAKLLSSFVGTLILAQAPPPTSEAALYADPIAKLALLLNDDNAGAWYALAGKPASLAPLAVAKGLVEKPQDALATYAAQKEIALDHRVNALAVLQALGVDLGSKIPLSLQAQSTSLPKPLQDAGLNNALHAGHKGEALLRAMLLTPSDAIGVHLARIHTLRALGYENEALLLALPRL